MNSIGVLLNVLSLVATLVAWLTPREKVLAWLRGASANEWWALVWPMALPSAYGVSIVYSAWRLTTARGFWMWWHFGWIAVLACAGTIFVWLVVKATGLIGAAVQRHYQVVEGHRDLADSLREHAKAQSELCRQVARLLKPTEDFLRSKGESEHATIVAKIRALLRVNARRHSDFAESVALTSLRNQQ